MKKRIAPKTVAQERIETFTQQKKGDLQSLPSCGPTWA